MHAVPEKTLCEFFAGIGLVREGLEPSGWRCVYANDIDPKKRQAYLARFPDRGHFHLGDVWDTDAVVARVPGRPALATASFPCVDLSLAGHYRGIEGKDSSAFFGFARALEALGERRPPLVLVENVPGFLSSRGGADFARATVRLSELGYWLDALVLDARHFTPQSRPRVFVVGMLEGHRPVGRADLPRSPAIVRAKRGVTLKTGWVTLDLPDPPAHSGTVAGLLDLDDAQAWWTPAETSRHLEMMSDGHRSRVDTLARGGRPWAGTIFRRIRQKRMRAEVRFDGLAGCLRTPRGGSAKQIVIATPGDGSARMRWMTPREYARLQGVPDFPLVGTTIQQLWGFADAVCAPAVAWLDRHVLSPLLPGVSGAAA